MKTLSHPTRGFLWRIPAFAFLALAAVGGAQARDVVDAPFVEEALKRGAIVWDTRDAAEYAKGHIPGALSIGEVGKALRDENREDYLPTARIEEILGAAGIDPAREIVVYGTTGDPYAHFALLTVRQFGGEQGHIYHDGIDDWKKLGKPVTTTQTPLAPVKLTLKAKPGVTVETAEVIARLKDPQVQIVDARSPREYQGADIRAIRGGHIPGAKNIPYEQNWQDPETPRKLAERKVAGRDTMALKPKDELKALYTGLDPAKETLVYCQSGVRAAETATVLRDLGFKDVKVYDSSWLGYGNTLDAPAEDVTFINVGLLLGRLNGLQARVEGLERALASLKSPAAR